jgi:hypothetical protein
MMPRVLGNVACHEKEASRIRDFHPIFSGWMTGGEQSLLNPYAGFPVQMKVEPD